MHRNQSESIAKKLGFSIAHHFRVAEFWGAEGAVELNIPKIPTTPKPYRPKTLAPQKHNLLFAVQQRLELRVGIVSGCNVIAAFDSHSDGATNNIARLCHCRHQRAVIAATVG
jgi:hypothetical protein